MTGDGLDFEIVRARRPAPRRPPVTARARAPHAVGRRLSRAQRTETTSDDDPDPASRRRGG